MDTIEIFGEIIAENIRELNGISEKVAAVVAAEKAKLENQQNQQNESN